MEPDRMFALRNCSHDWVLYLSDILVLPHRTRTQFDLLPSNKLLDYIASGKPIVSYRLSSTASMLKEYPLKILVEPNDPTKLAEGMMKALDLYNGSRIDGRLYVERYDQKTIGEKLLDVYKKITAA